MSDLSGIKLLGGSFAVWPATMQVMPGGVVDATFGRFFIAVRLSNGGTSAWPITHARLSPRSRQQLLNAGLLIDDAWSVADAQAFDQQVSGEFVVVPAMPAGAQRAIFFKVDATLAHPGVHDLEIELRDPAAPTVTVTARVPLRIARTKFDSHTLSFVTTADKGTVTTSLATAAFDVEALRRALARARAAFPPGPSSNGSVLSQLDRLRGRLQGFICGDNGDICQILGEINTFCALPQPVNPPPIIPPPAGSATGLDGYAVFADGQVSFADRVKITGATGSNTNVTTGTDGALTGDVLSGGDVILGDREVATGAITAAGFVKKDTATAPGPVREHATYFPLTIPTRPVTPGSTDVPVPSGTRALTVGNYGIVTASTTGKATLTFVAGLYQMKRLVLGPDTTLSFDVSAGPIEIRCSELLTFGDRTVFTVTGGSGASRIQLYSDQTSELRIGTDIPTFTGVLTAPKATIHAYSRTTVRGSLFGKSVILEPDISVIQTAPMLGSGQSWLGTGSSGLELLAYPIALDYTLDYATGFFGSSGPLAFDGLAWKSLLANANLLFNLVLGGALPASLGRTADELVVGRVKTAVLNALANAPGTAPPPTQAGSVDAATLSLLGNRALGSPPYAALDAQTGEANATAVNARDGRFTWSGSFLKNTEISALIAASASDPDGLKVHKSGAGSGVTRGVLSALIPVFKRQDPGGALHFINQLSIIPDAASPAADGQVATAGDSGALWIHTRTGKAIALGHATGSGGSTVASRIEDVMTALKVAFA